MGFKNTTTLATAYQLSLESKDFQDCGEAEQLLREVVESMSEVHGADHEQAMAATCSLAA